MNIPSEDQLVLYLKIDVSLISIRSKQVDFINNMKSTPFNPIHQNSI